WDGRIDAEKTAQVDLAFGLNGQAVESNASHGALRHITDRHAGVERRDQILLRVGEAVRPAELGRLVDIDREAARDHIAADADPLDPCPAALLPWPCRGPPPMGFAACRLALDALDQREEVIDIDAVDDFRRNGSCVTVHENAPEFARVVGREANGYC